MPGWYNANLKNPSGADRAHISRYLLARGFVNPGEIVVDAACGTGYGSRLLAEVAKHVYGYDIDFNAIVIASKNKPKNITFSTVSLENANIKSCDVIVSLETIEHLTDPKSVIRKFYRRARRGLIFSVPLGEEKGANPFHKSVFTKGDILGLVGSAGWKMFHSFMQGNHFIGIAEK